MSVTKVSDVIWAASERMEAIVERDGGESTDDIRHLEALRDALPVAVEQERQLAAHPAFLRLLAAAKELRSPTFTPDDADFGLCALCRQRDYEGHSADCEWIVLREAIAEAEAALKGDADAAHHLF